MIPWWVTLIIAIGCAFLGMILMALIIADGGDDK